MSKGSKPRPFSVSNEEYANRWDAIFGKDLEKKMSSYADIEMKIIQWSEARKIIPNSTPAAQFKKLQEEINELYEAMRNDDMDMVIDGIGDSMVCLINICALYDINLVNCMEAAYLQIKDRKGYLTPEGIFVKQV